MDKSRAQELIKEFEQHQQRQIECLKALLDLGGPEEGEGVVRDGVQEKTLTTDEGTSVEISGTPAPSSVNVLDGPLQGNGIQIPDEWAMPWSNALLHQRIEEREKEPGCGGGLRRS